MDDKGVSLEEILGDIAESKPGVSLVNGIKKNISYIILAGAAVVAMIGFGAFYFGRQSQQRELETRVAQPTPTLELISEVTPTPTSVPTFTPLPEPTYTPTETSTPTTVATNTPMSTPRKSPTPTPTPIPQVLELLLPKNPNNAYWVACNVPSFSNVPDIFDYTIVVHTAFGNVLELIEQGYTVHSQVIGPDRITHDKTLDKLLRMGPFPQYAGKEVDIRLWAESPKGRRTNVIEHDNYFIPRCKAPSEKKPTPTPTVTPTPSGTPEPTPSGTPEPTPSGTPEPTPTNSLMPIQTSTPTLITTIMEGCEGLREYYL